MVNKEWSDLYRDEKKDISQVVLSLIHQKAYELAKPLCQNKKILEIGCGAGYGARYLSTVAKEIIAVDIDENAIDYARKYYGASNITYQKIGKNYSLPFDSNIFDIVILFQVIEHIPIQDVIGYLLEIKSILKPNGILLLTTPNRNFRLLPFQKPWNLCHYSEYTPRKLKTILKRVFRSVEIMGLRGVPELEYIEKKRVRQSPIEFYIIRPIKTFLRHFVPGKIREKIKNRPVLISREIHRLNQMKTLDNKNISKFYNFTLSDLLYTNHKLHKSIDLLASSKKSDKEGNDDLLS